MKLLCAACGVKRKEASWFECAPSVNQLQHHAALGDVEDVRVGVARMHGDAGQAVGERQHQRNSARAVGARAEDWNGAQAGQVVDERPVRAPAPLAAARRGEMRVGPARDHEHEGAEQLRDLGQAGRGAPAGVKVARHREQPLAVASIEAVGVGNVIDVDELVPDTGSAGRVADVAGNLIVINPDPRLVRVAVEVVLHQIRGDAMAAVEAAGHADGLGRGARAQFEQAGHGVAPAIGREEIDFKLGQGMEEVFGTGLRAVVLADLCPDVRWATPA